MHLLAVSTKQNWHREKMFVLQIGQPNRRSLLVIEYEENMKGRVGVGGPLPMHPKFATGAFDENL